MFVLTSAFPSQSSIILCPASFWTPRSHLPVPLLLLTLDVGCLLTAAAAILGHWVSPHSRRCWHWTWGVSFGCSPLQCVQQLLPLRKAQPPQTHGESSVQTCFLSFNVPSPLYCLQWCSVHHSNFSIFQLRFYEHQADTPCSLSSPWNHLLLPASLSFPLDTSGKWNRAGFVFL